MRARPRTTLPLLIGLGSLALGPGSAPAAADAEQVAETTDGLRALHDGDRSWFADDRRAAVAAWRAAVETGEPAAAAMAHLRLLLFSGNWGMAVHGPRYDRAMAACPDGEPWCELAAVDFHLLAPPEVGAELEQAVQLSGELVDELEGPALARLVLAGQAQEHLPRLAEIERDGLGDGLLASEGRPPPYQGTWLLGIGLLGGPGLGFGGGLHFVHPDLFLRGHDLGLEAGATTRGSAWLGAAGASAGRVFGHGDLSVSRWVQDLWVDGEASEWRVEGLQAAAGPGLRLDHLRLTVAGRARWDRVSEEALLGVGPELGASIDHRAGWGGSRRGWYLGTRWRSSLDVLGGDYDHLRGTAELRGYTRGPWESVLAGRILGERAFVDGAPWMLLPSAGGADLLRGAPAGRFRGDSLAALDLEWRRMVTGPLEGVAFACGAWIQDAGLHPCGGLGLRLLMPPRELNVVRLDLAVSDAGWAVTTGWGEVF